jgi:SOS-response transcriptional repressor LexA
MHPTQKAILRLLGNTKSIPLKLRWIGREVGEEHPQKIKYHIHQLEKIGAVAVDLDKKEIIKNTIYEDGAFVTLPIMGTANCGGATALAEDRIEGFMKISKGLLPKSSKKLFVLRASGDSMNNLSAPNLENKTIDDGDYVVVEKTEEASNKDIVVSIIDGYANIKKFFHQGTEIALLSESKRNLPPIFIHEDDADKYQIAGKVVKIIKQPRFSID